MYGHMIAVLVLVIAPLWALWSGCLLLLLPAMLAVEIIHGLFDRELVLIVPPRTAGIPILDKRRTDFKIPGSEEPTDG